ncbi:MAG: hypothetical protein LBG21_04580 [Campylobacteraceae bacterium]|nr:hypothetical protein [Campylobacteraceae bacterium]
MMVSMPKFSTLFSLKFKVLTFSLLSGLFLIGCGGDDLYNNGSGGSTTGGNVPSYTISFLDDNLDVFESVTKESGNVNITYIAENELGINVDVYAANGVLVKGNSDFEEFNLTKNVVFYTANVNELDGSTGLIVDNASGKYILTGDIELNNPWVPIGNITDPFDGVFNGNGHKVTNLSISGGNGVGFFGYVKDAQIKNLGIEINGELKGNDHVGGIAGYAKDSNITNSYSKGDISGSNYVGGIAGYAENNNVNNSYSRGDIGGTSDSVGGIAGYAKDSNITNSYSTGNINGNNNVGGIVGWTDNADIIHNVAINLYINASIASNKKANRIVGYSNLGNITDNFALNSTEVDGIVVPDNDYNGANKTEAELQKQSTYEILGWEFGEDDAKPWKINEGKGLPYFYWEDL